MSGPGGAGGPRTNSRTPQRRDQHDVLTRPARQDFSNPPPPSPPSPPAPRHSCYLPAQQGAAREVRRAGGGGGGCLSSGIRFTCGGHRRRGALRRATRRATRPAPRRGPEHEDDAGDAGSAGGSNTDTGPPATAAPRAPFPTPNSSTGAVEPGGLELSAIGEPVLVPLRRLATTCGPNSCQCRHLTNSWHSWGVKTQPPVFLPAAVRAS